MVRSVLRRWLHIIGLCAILTGIALAQNTANAAVSVFADPAFSRVWNRTDSLIANGTLSRSYLWGPKPNSAAVQEDYKESPGGKRIVQYFDKSRMEINNPGSDPNSAYYVSNGLLTVELISGKMQTGDSTFVSHLPATIPVAGDPDDTLGPTYAALAGVTGPASNGTIGRMQANDVTPYKGVLINQTIDRLGAVTQERPGTGGVYDVFDAYFVPETSHNVAGVFWTYLNQSGLISNGAKTFTGRLFDPAFYATGFPITEAYWAHVKVGGAVHNILIQAFQRRVLTYEPQAPAAYQVQMGNIGQHYFKWRYGTTDNPKVAYPGSMAALGDSITRGFNSGSTLLDTPANAWATGDNPAVNSQFLRFSTRKSGIQAYNDAKSGAKMDDLNRQAQLAVTQKVEYVTILLGANDVCAPNEAAMTPLLTFRTEFDTALKTLTSGLPTARIFVASIPNTYNLWYALKDNPAAQNTWATYNICQSMLANPLSTTTTDGDRRTRVAQYTYMLNAQLREVCADYTQCRSDGSAVFNTPFTAAEVSTLDYFHPSIAGQTLLADITYGLTYNFSD